MNKIYEVKFELMISSNMKRKIPQNQNKGYDFLARVIIIIIFLNIS